MGRKIKVSKKLTKKGEGADAIELRKYENTSAFQGYSVVRVDGSERKIIESVAYSPGVERDTHYTKAHFTPTGEYFVWTQGDKKTHYSVKSEEEAKK